MTLYESNFIKLGNLLQPDAVLRPKRLRSAVSVCSSDCDLHLELRIVERYTTTVKLTYWLDDEHGRRVADPNLTIRIYHDARLVEAVAAAGAHHHHKLRELARHEHGEAHSLELDRRWRNNMMLNKWLDYVVDMGHRFR